MPTPEEREATHALRIQVKKERKFLRAETERLQKKLERAEKVTDEITRMAFMMKLIRNVEWMATPSKAK